jgi:hypothetical protein
MLLDCFSRFLPLQARIWFLREMFYSLRGWDAILEIRSRLLVCGALGL